jgi:hypothetical protein
MHLLSWADGRDTERRAKERRDISCPMVLAPINHDGRLLSDQPVRIKSKDISESGLGFVHADPLPHKRAVISFDMPNAGRFAVEVLILWTNIDASGKYESGCRMIRKTADHTLCD